MARSILGITLDLYVAVAVCVLAPLWISAHAPGVIWLLPFVAMAAYIVATPRGWFDRHEPEGLFRHLWTHLMRPEGEDEDSED